MIRIKRFAIDRDDILKALQRLGELAQAHNLKLTLCLIGEALMIIEYGARKTTRRVDAVILEPSKRDEELIEMASIIAKDNGWPDDWLNTDAGSHIHRIKSKCLLAGPGIEVHAPVTAQVLALKLLDWNSDADIKDAIRLRKEIPGDREDVWREIEQFLPMDPAATPDLDF